MSEGLQQITIPDFDDDDVLVAPSAFGRSGFGFGGGSGFGGGGSFGGGSSFGGGGSFGGSSSGFESPGGTTTPLSAFHQQPERSFFSHTRGDSSTSVDSAGSATTRYASKPSTPFSHSSQPSTSTGFPRKASFASIRNAFKSGSKNNDVPPMPPIDHGPLPVLKNPFNRSTSSLTQVAPSLGRSMTSTPSSGMRPLTPGSTDTKFGRSLKLRGHGNSKSHHSHSGSMFNASDGGSDYYAPSPPPVPRVPALLQDVEEDKVVMDPKTPSDFALHAVFIRFAALSEEKIDSFVQHSLDHEPLLTTLMGPGVDPKFDETLHSLGIIAQKHAKKVIDSVMRWRRSQSETSGAELSAARMQHTRGQSRKDIPAIVNERKSLAAIYIMCRALVAILQLLSRDALGDTLGYNLEETTFEQFRRPDLKSLAFSANRRINSELYATLLGHLANVRFVSVTDRFLAELGPVSMGQVTKDMNPRYENLVRGLRHIKIKVWPPEAFEEAAEFMESLSKSYVNAHGHLKVAFAEALISLLHPIGKTAQAETNNPQWGKAIEVIYPKAREMMAKRYWQVAFPLAITSLCVAPQTYFLKYWQSFFEASVSKLKERPSRTIVLNGLVRLVWTYLYRCQEAPSTTMKKLETLLKNFFPPNRTAVFPPDEHVEPLVYMLHFILSRHPEYGREMCLELLQESAILGSQQKAAGLSSILAPERTLIVVSAVLLSVHNLEREVMAPTWPSSSDFTAVPSKDDYPSSSAYLPTSSLKPGVLEFIDKCAHVLCTIATHCASTVGRMSVFDDQWSYAKVAPAYEESSNFVIRRHVDGIMTAYPINLVPQISLLQTSFHAWPRLLHSSTSLPDAVEILLRGVIHVEPTVADAAKAALKRVMDDDANALQVVSQFNNFLFSPARISDSGVRLFVEYSPLLLLWVELVDEWLKGIIQRGIAAHPQPEQVIAKCSELEAASLFLLSHWLPSINSAGVKVIRTLGQIAPLAAAFTGSDDLYIVDRFRGKIPNEAYLNGYDELLDNSEQSRLDQWRRFKGEEVALRIVDSPNEKDRKLWRFVFPAFLQDSMKHSTASISSLREAIIAAVLRYHPSISYLAGLSHKAPPGLAPRNPMERDGSKLVMESKAFVDQWHLWIKILCSTAMPPDTTRPTYTKVGRDHTRAPSDVSFERERYMTTRGLFRHLTPFLDSEYTIFRDTAVLCISSFPHSAYPQLLEDLGLLAGRQPYDDPRAKAVTTPSAEQNFGLLPSRQLYDESKSKLGGPFVLTERNRRQERLHSAVARIYSLTAHLLQHQRSSARQNALLSILKFIRNTQIFLASPDVRDNPSFHRLRRYFCGIIEQFFTELSNLKDSDRFIPSHMHLTLYRMCEEWCQIGPQSEASKKRMAAMLNSLENSDRDSVQRFRHECALLSQAAVGTLTALCYKAFFPPDQVESSPVERFPSDLTRALSVPSILDRLSAIMASSPETTQIRARVALKSLLTHEESLQELSHEVLRRAIVIMDKDKAETSNQRFFEVFADIVASERHHFTFAETVCLCLTNLRHPSPAIRSLAFNALESIHHQHSGLLTMSNFEAFVGSLASSTYIHAHRSIADFLAGEHPGQAVRILAQLGNWLPQLPGEAYDTDVILLLLQSLENWIPNINLMTEDNAAVSREGLSCLYHLTSLTLTYNQSHAEQILVLWAKLVEHPHQSNGHAAVRFLLEQAHKVGNIVFVTCASNVVAALCQTQIGRQIYEELCSVIEPIHMLPAIEHKLVFPQELDMKLWEDLDALFGEQPRLTLGSAQFAWLFLSDVTLQRNWEMMEQLPTLLHAIFTHLDHRVPFVRQRAHSMLFQLLRSWTPGYDELSDRSAPSQSRMMIKESIHALEKEAPGLYWEEGDSSDQAVPKMKELVSRVLSLLEPLAPHIVNQWGSMALAWGTACSIRPTAFRSLQIFRALMPRVKKADFALLLGRLSNTVASSEENIQSFTSEIFSAIKAVVTADDVDKSLLPQLFWCACACLSTTVEEEFGQTISLLEALLTKINLDDQSTIDHIMAHKPTSWSESPYLQPLLLRGLQSSTLSSATMRLLQTLLKVQDDQLIDPSEGRLRAIYTVSLPWCLHAMDQAENPAKELAEDISLLAARENRHSIQKIMNSFAKGHFRTRDDFLRQAVSSLREHYGAQHWTQIVTHLLGLVLNKERWLRIHAMQVLKVLFQHRETRNPVELLGSELLMPLLRLLETDLAPQALDVLEEPMAMSGGGLAAKHVLRMSMHFGNMLPPSDPESVTTVFGVPAESGWCIAQPEALRATCQSNVMSVFDTCSVPTRPSRIEFEPEVEALQSIKTPLADDLSGLMNSIHQMTDVFHNGASTVRASTIPTRRLEARVAAILAKSNGFETIPDTPQTPFLDVFTVPESDHSNDSDDYSDSDSEVDAFVFDTILPLRTTPNGYHPH